MVNPCAAFFALMSFRKSDSHAPTDEELFGAVSRGLRERPHGLSEHELLRSLHAEGYFAFLGKSPWDPHDLFCAHFLLFHVLYQLRDRAWQAREAHLEISPLSIRWLPYQDGEGALGSPDPLREYYLDISNLEGTSARDVDELLASFWVRLQNQDQRAGALSELGLSDPVDDATIKNTYRKLAMQHHPDRGGDTERLQAINAAVSVLLKPV